MCEQVEEPGVEQHHAKGEESAGEGVVGQSEQL
jgi:hypothetical protein